MLQIGGMFVIASWHTVIQLMLNVGEHPTPKRLIRAWSWSSSSICQAHEYWGCATRESCLKSLLSNYGPSFAPSIHTSALGAQSSKPYRLLLKELGIIGSDAVFNNYLQPQRWRMGHQ